MKTLSLFSGGGGMDLGFERAGFDIETAIEFDRSAAVLYRVNIGDSVTAIDVLEFDAGNSGYEAVIAGPPCQGFSTAGRNNPDDPRNALLQVPAKIAIAVSADLVVIENVRSARSDDEASIWQQTMGMLVGAGYAVTTIDLSAQDVGLPQLRRRAFIVATREPVNLRFERKPSPTVLGSLLDDIEGQTDHSPTSLRGDSVAGSIAKRIPPGCHLSDVRFGDKSVHSWEVPEVFGNVSRRQADLLLFVGRERRRMRSRSTGDGDPVTMSRITASFGSSGEDLSSLVNLGYLRRTSGGFDLRRTFNGAYRRLDRSEPCPAVDTRAANPRRMLHPVEDRPLTVRELARIQGFPDSYQFSSVSKTAAVRVIGNALPPPMAEELARAIRAET